MDALAAMPRYEAYKESGVDWLGNVPDSWELTRLGTRFFERRAKVSDTDFPPLSVTKQGILPQLENAAKTKDGDNRKLVKSGDFVINSRSDRKGSSGVSDRDGSVSLINIVLEPKGIHPKFSEHLLKSYAFVEEYYRVGRGIVADLWTTRYDEMRTIILAVPSYQEQAAIANFLDQKTAQIDEAIVIKEKQIALLKERKQIIIQKAVTQGLDPNKPMKDSGLDWIGQIPAHWEVNRLKFLLSDPLKYGANESGVDYDASLPRYVRITDFSGEGKLSDENRLSLPWSVGKDYLLKDGDILLARSGATVGKSYQFKASMSEDKNYCFAGYLIRARCDEEKMLSDYLNLYLNSDCFLSWRNLIFNKATIENIGADKYSTLSVIVPPVDEQGTILSYLKNKLEPIGEGVSHTSKQIEILKEYKTTLINSAVTGKIKVA